MGEQPITYDENKFISEPSKQDVCIRNGNDDGLGLCSLLER